MKNLLNKDTHPLATAFGFLIGQVISIFFWSVGLFYAYKWFSWNFNLPEMTYLNMACVFTAFHVIISGIAKVFKKN